MTPTERVASAEALVAARESRGLSIDDIQRQLKLHPRQVHAIEAGDWSALPGLPFVRGTVRNYGKIVGVDVEPLLESISGSTKAPELRSSSSLDEPLRPGGMMGFGNGGSGSRWIWLLVAIAAVIALVLFFGRDGDLSKIPSLFGGAASTPEATTRSSSDGVDAVPITPPPGSGSAPGATAAAGSAGASVPVPPPLTPAPASPSASASGSMSGLPSQGSVAGTTASGNAGSSTATTSTSATSASAAPAAASATVAPSDASAAAPAASAAPVAPSLKLSFDADAWVEIRQRSDNKVLSIGTQKAKTSMDFPVNTAVSVTLGNAEKVKAEFNGKPLQLKVQPGTGIAKLTLP